MSSVVLCPHCQAGLAAAPTLAGQTVTCPHCGGVFALPATIAAPPPSAPSATPPSGAVPVSTVPVTPTSVPVSAYPAASIPPSYSDASTMYGPMGNQTGGYGGSPAADEEEPPPKRRKRNTATIIYWTVAAFGVLTFVLLCLGMYGQSLRRKAQNRLLGHWVVDPPRSERFEIVFNSDDELQMVDALFGDGSKVRVGRWKVVSALADQAVKVRFYWEDGEKQMVGFLFRSDDLLEMPLTHAGDTLKLKRQP